MTMADYDAVMELLRATEGVVLRTADSRAAIERYLRRNPGMSFVAVDAARTAGCILGGHDGRRGYLHHIAVAREYRGRGIARALIDRAVERLKAEGIDKFHVDVLSANSAGQAFWTHIGWTRRTDIIRFSK